MRPIVQQVLVKKIRETGFKTLGEFARAAGMRQCVLSDLIRGRRPISQIYAVRIQAGLDRGPGGAGLVYDTTLKGGEAK